MKSVAYRKRFFRSVILFSKPFKINTLEKFLTVRDGICLSCSTLILLQPA
jgi:hypothetical protein